VIGMTLMGMLQSKQTKNNMAILGYGE